jgi:transcriptional regulator with XRE-family HTH domain
VADRNPVLVVFGERILRERKARGWSQRELAGKAGISPDAPRKYERALNEAGVTSALAIADALGLQLDAMLRPPGCCGTCRNEPHAGFRCLACGREGAL